MPDLLPAIAAQVAGRSQARPAGQLGELFDSPSPGEAPLFLRLLKVQSNQVHFLHFWKAFGEAARLAGARPQDGLASELETLRDAVLRRLTEVEALPTIALVEEVHRAASMSAYPQFWRAEAETLSAHLELESLSLEQLTSVLLSWLHDATMWEQQQRNAEANEGSMAYLQRAVSLVSGVSTPSGQSLFWQDESSKGLPVRVHIYDVSQQESIQRINKIFAHKRSPLKLGGVFHAGVEVNGLEWSYGFTLSETRSGVSCVEPRAHPQHHYRQTVALSGANMPEGAIANIISDLIEEYPGDDYDLLRRNCCHFADDFCKRLGTGGIPGWVHRLARLGASVDTMLKAAPRPVKERLYYADIRY